MVYPWTEDVKILLKLGYLFWYEQIIWEHVLDVFCADYKTNKRANFPKRIE